mmetsp:Transcript_60453/g.136653  ORF Transcript_60453/g.136653 Transcript_60453/m.136653 type:complete len:341 (-) Transcript_60453:16-1038(-)
MNLGAWGLGGALGEDWRAPLRSPPSPHEGASPRLGASFQGAPRPSSASSSSGAPSHLSHSAGRSARTGRLNWSSRIIATASASNRNASSEAYPSLASLVKISFLFSSNTELSAVSLLSTSSSMSPTSSACVSVRMSALLTRASCSDSGSSFSWAVGASSSAITSFKSDSCWSAAGTSSVPSVIVSSSSSSQRTEVVFSSDSSSISPRASSDETSSSSCVSGVSASSAPSAAAVSADSESVPSPRGAPPRTATFFMYHSLSFSRAARLAAWIFSLNCAPRGSWASPAALRRHSSLARELRGNRRKGAESNESTAGNPERSRRQLKACWPIELAELQTGRDV